MKALCQLTNNFRGLFNVKVILIEKQEWYYLTHTCRNKGVHAFLKCFSLKMNVIAQLEFQYVYHDVTVQHVSHCATTTPLAKLYLNLINHRFFLKTNYFQIVIKNSSIVNRCVIKFKHFHRSKLIYLTSLFNFFGIIFP